MLVVVERLNNEFGEPWVLYVNGRTHSHTDTGGRPYLGDSQTGAAYLL